MGESGAGATVAPKAITVTPQSLEAAPREAPRGAAGKDRAGSESWVVRACIDEHAGPTWVLDREVG